jgi:hypothetical protein
MARDLLGEIPDSHFENEPSTYPPTEIILSAECLEWIKRLKVQVARLLDHGSDKYKPGDVVGGF